jgi:hypothetical protein
MSDMRALAAGLEEYRQTVERHVLRLRDEFDEVGRYWLALAECYAGSAADEFRPVWEGTRERFREYVEHTTAIVRVLGERIDSLREADRVAGPDG